MRTVTFLRMRPVEAINPIAASTRRREGSTVLEISGATAADLEAAAGADLLVAGVGVGATTPAVWVVEPADALDLSASGVPGWRITVADGESRELILDALARTGAAFLRTGRSGVARAADLCGLPAVAGVPSVFVDDVDQARAAVETGAGDLLLRGWNTDQVGRLRETLAGYDLVERTVIPSAVTIDTVRAHLPAPWFTVWLHQVDASGRARPRNGWAPGKDEQPPVPALRMSAQWLDETWVTGRAPDHLDGAGDLAPVLERSLEGTPPTPGELVELFSAHGDQVDAVARTADVLRQRAVGEAVSYVVNRNINYTNMCYFRCGFCAFSKGPRSLNLRGEPYLMGIDEIVERAREAWNRGATEVTLQGGIHPEFTGEFYVNVIEGIKADLPDMHIHGFTPLEVWQGAETLGIGVRPFLTILRDAGLGSLPGTAAEILDDRIRHHLCPDKIRTAQWADVMLTAHDLGLAATATVMFGHIDDPLAWARHLEVIRNIQRRTGGFTEFVPLPFVHMGSPIYLRGEARPGPTWDEVVLMHAVARIAFDGLIPNIQASWVKLGLDGGARLLAAGCNDLGGTLMGEIITRSAGASHGQELAPADFVRAIDGAGRTPVRRSTLYEVLEGV